MTDNPITLPAGQVAQFRDGVVQVQPRPAAACHYKLTAQHRSGGLLDIKAASYDAVIACLKQLEPLGYTMKNIVRLEG